MSYKIKTEDVHSLIKELNRVAAASNLPVHEVLKHAFLHWVATVQVTLTEMGVDNPNDAALRDIKIILTEFEELAKLLIVTEEQKAHGGN